MFRGDSSSHFGDESARKYDEKIKATPSAFLCWQTYRGFSSLFSEASVNLMSAENLLCCHRNTNRYGTVEVLAEIMYSLKCNRDEQNYIFIISEESLNDQSFPPQKSDIMWTREIKAINKSSFIRVNPSQVVQWSLSIYTFLIIFA